MLVSQRWFSARHSQRQIKRIASRPQVQYDHGRAINSQLTSNFRREPLDSPNLPGLESRLFTGKAFSRHAGQRAAD